MVGAVSRLARAARRALPTPASTAALRAALWAGDGGREAFTRWADEVGDPRALPPERRQAVRELAPQLEVARQTHGLAAPGALGLLLRLAADHERRRWRPYRDAALDLLADEADPVISGGLATAFAAYPEPALRHCHDLDRLGPSPASTTHPSGLPGEVHPGRVPAVWGADGDLGAIRARAVPDDRLGRPLHRLAVGDLLVTVLVYSLAGRRPDSVRWASDAWLLAGVATDADWRVLATTLAEHRLGPVVLPALTYLAEDLRGGVPPAILDEVAEGPGPDPDRTELAVTWARRRRMSPSARARLGAGVRRRAGRRQPAVAPARSRRDADEQGAVGP